MYLGNSRDGLYENVLADSEREAVADLLQYLENVHTIDFQSLSFSRTDTVYSVGKRTSSRASLSGL